MNKLTIILTVLIFSLSGTVNAQINEKCGTMHNHAEIGKNILNVDSKRAQIEYAAQQWLKSHKNDKSSSVATIPVVFHIVYNTAAQNIHDSIVYSQLEVMNNDFTCEMFGVDMTLLLLPEKHQMKF